MSLLEELTLTIVTLEAQLPANPRSPENARLEKRLQRELARYFRSLEDAFPFDRLDGIYYRYVKESLGGEAGEMLDSILAAFDSQLQGNIAGQLATTYYSGSTQMISYGQTKMGVPITFEGPPISEAIEWAEKHSATLVKGMNKETKKRLAHTISQGIENKRGIPGLSRDIRMSFDDMGRYRSQLIARTETANALSTASLERMGDMGIDGKEWVTVGDAEVSPECLGNESEGVIPTKQTFSGGVLAPPQHPNCRCAIAPAMLPEPEKPPVEPVPKAEPPPPKVEPGVSKATQDFINDKVKVVGGRQYDIDGLSSTVEAIKVAKLPDSHLATVRSLQLNTAKVQRRTHGSMAYCDGSNNIVLAGKVGHENVIHEIGHSFFQRTIMIPNDPKKYDVMNAFSASTRTGKGFVSQYARVDAEEFFAECYAAFATNPTAFMKLNPTMGKLLKAYWKL